MEPMDDLRTLIRRYQLRYGGSVKQAAKNMRRDLREVVAEDCTCQYCRG